MAAGRLSALATLVLSSLLASLPHNEALSLSELQQDAATTPPPPTRRRRTPKQYGRWVRVTAGCYHVDNSTDIPNDSTAIPGPGLANEDNACGYGNLTAAGNGLKSAQASLSLFGGGAQCGACWELHCSGPHQACLGAAVTVTVTDVCPADSPGGWCAAGRWHLDLPCPTWDRIAAPRLIGVIKTRARRVPCRRRGGVRFLATANETHAEFLISNLGGPGDLRAVEVSSDQGATWISLSRAFGSTWSFSGGDISPLKGEALSFRLVAGVSQQQLTLVDVLPPNWQSGETYEAGKNYPVPGRQRTKAPKRNSVETSLIHDSL